LEEIEDVTEEGATNGDDLATVTEKAKEFIEG
jgi:hypothetical protein